MVHAPSHAKKHQEQQAEHTPGPWYASEDTVYKTRHWSGVVADCNVGSTPLAQRTANARLIAAAPDLLEALKAIMQRDAGRGDLTVEHARAAFAAIDRAEGRQ